MKTGTKILAIGIMMVLSSFSDIVRRHDIDDSKYLEFGKKFPGVCKVGALNGDGTYIGDGWVLTAAHVIVGLELKEGKQKVYFGDQSYAIDKTIKHPKYQTVGSYDIGLVKLKKVPDFEVYPLYTKKDERGKDIIIVGHGWAKHGDTRTWLDKNGDKRAATNKIERVTDDQVIFNFSHPDSSETTELEGTAGPGDSGGPAFIELDGKYYVAGVSSGGIDGRNGPGTYGAIEHFTRVSSYLDWIGGIVGE